MAHWHGLAKLRMHSGLTLDILDQQTTKLGDQFLQFKEQVCSAYNTQELDREADARARQQVKEAGQRVEIGRSNGKGQGDTAQQPKTGANTKGKQKASPELGAPLPRQPKRKRSFNLNTYKFHALGDYVASIRRFGTTDSYSTEPGELKHRTPKSRYSRTDTDRRAFVHQLTQIERHQTRLRRIKEQQQNSPLVLSLTKPQAILMYTIILVKTRRYTTS
ncbi:hypothetical protein BDR03DRAFT_1017918 [Suillus americanus]|nr:hypothetical protein BDR03DRAFT_1017918 [Suillus americanus]